MENLFDSVIDRPTDSDEIEVSALPGSSKDFFSRMVSKFPDLIVIIDDNLRVVYVSQACVPTNPGANSFLHKKLIEIFPETYASRVEDKVKFVLNTGSPEFIEYSFLQGSMWHDYEFRLTLFKAGQVMVVVRDFSQIKKSRDAILMEQKLSIAGQLAGGIAHDFNNQLMGVLGYAELLSSEIKDPLQREYLDFIKLAASKTADLTAQMLSFSRRGNNLCVTLDLHSILIDVERLVMLSAERSIEVRHHLKSNKSMLVGDPEELQKVFIQLASNALEAMPEGGVLIFMTNLVAAEAIPHELHLNRKLSGDYICVSVEDTGIGIPRDNLVRIFEPFFTTKKNRKTGSGMGLPAVYGAVDSHNGVIQVNSIQGGGTEVRVYLPLSSHIMEVRDREDEYNEDIHCKARILMIDAEKLIADLIPILLEKHDIKASAFTEAEAALTYYKHSWKSIDLILLDIVLPQIGSSELIHKIRNINPDAKIMLMSGYSEVLDINRLKEEGIKSVVYKPISANDLVKEIADNIK